VKHLLHPKFKLNGRGFSSAEELKVFAKEMLFTGEGETISIGKFILEWLDENIIFEVYTSGSTGIPKKISLQKEHAYNSAIATIDYFEIGEGTRALLCLPADYIAGKMMLVRGMVGGWDLFITSPQKNPLSHFEMEFEFSAMVPYQVHHSLSELHKVKQVIVGGGAVSIALENEIQNLPTKMFATYGMTETISHIAVRSLNGRKRSLIYNAIPRVQFSQTSEGCLCIDAPLISAETVITNDIVELLSKNSFRLLGRRDNVINTGGVKVHPEIIEQKLAKNFQVPFFIASEKDEVLGQKVILILESTVPQTLEENSRFFDDLTRYEKPKKIYITPEFEFTETGKIRRSEVVKKVVG